MWVGGGGGGAEKGVFECYCFNIYFELKMYKHRF